MFKVNNKDTRTMSLLLISTIFHTLFSVCIVNFEDVFADWADSNSLAYLGNDKYWTYLNYSLSVMRFSYHSLVACWLNKLQVVGKH